MHSRINLTLCCNISDGAAKCQLPASWIPARYHRPTHPTHTQRLPPPGKHYIVTLDLLKRYLEKFAQNALDFLPPTFQKK